MKTFLPITCFVVIAVVAVSSYPNYNYQSFVSGSYLPANNNGVHSKKPALPLASINLQPPIKAPPASQYTEQHNKATSQYNIPLEAPQQFIAQASTIAGKIQQSAPQTNISTEQSTKPQQKTIISKDIYIHTAPEDTDEIKTHLKETEALPIRKNYRIVFIKAPAHKIKFNSEILKQKQALIEEKTIIYVLSQKPDYSGIQDGSSFLQFNQKTSKPEVYFIKYKTQDEANRAQQEIQTQYEALGGSTNIYDEGIAPITSATNSTKIVNDASDIFIGSNGIQSDSNSKQKITETTPTSTKPHIAQLIVNHHQQQQPPQQQSNNNHKEQSVQSSNYEQEKSIQSANNNQQEFKQPASSSEQQFIQPATKSQEQFIQPATNNQEQFIQPASSSEQQFLQPATNNHQQFIQPASNNQQQFIQPASNSEQQFIQPASNSEQQFIQPASNSEQQFIQPASNNEQQFIQPASNSEQQFIQPATNNQPQYIQPVSNNQQQFIQPAINSEQQFIQPATNNQQQFIQPATNNQAQFIQPATNNQHQFIQPASSSEQQFIQPSANNQPQFTQSASNNQPQFIQSVGNNQQQIENCGFENQQPCINSQYIDTYGPNKLYLPSKSI